jgi:hypothetical protein
MPKGIRKGKSPQKYKADYTEKDYYKYYFKTYCRKEGKSLDNDYNIDKHLYYDILGEFNKYLVNQMIHKGEDIIFPCSIGGLGLRKRKPSVKIDDEGNFKSLKPIDWDTTLKLWESDPDAKEKKLLIRHMNDHTDGYVFESNYIRKKAIFKGARHYDFIPTRTVKLMIKDKAKQGDLDAIIKIKFKKYE